MMDSLVFLYTVEFQTRTYVGTETTVSSEEGNHSFRKYNVGKGVLSRKWGAKLSISFQAE